MNEELIKLIMEKIESEGMTLRESIIYIFSLKEDGN